MNLNWENKKKKSVKIIKFNKMSILDDDISHHYETVFYFFIKQPNYKIQLFNKSYLKYNFRLIFKETENN